MSENAKLGTHFAKLLLVALAALPPDLAATGHHWPRCAGDVCLTLANIPGVELVSETSEVVFDPPLTLGRSSRAAGQLEFRFSGGRQLRITFLEESECHARRIEWSDRSVRGTLCIAGQDGRGVFALEVDGLAGEDGDLSFKHLLDGTYVQQRELSDGTLPPAVFIGD